jgi:uncharacterized protein
MRMNEVTYTDAVPIDGYGPGFFRVAGKVHNGPLCMAGGGVMPWSGMDDIGPLLALAGQVDVIFVGTGSEIAHIDPAVRDPLEAVGIGVEIMASPSAARTYNVLLSEGRRVAVALLPVG